MNRHSIVTNARAQSADAFMCAIVRMALGLGGWRSPGEGDAASP